MELVHRVTNYGVIACAIVVRQSSSTMSQLTKSAPIAGSSFIERQEAVVGGGGPGGGGGTHRAPQLFLVDADRTPPQAGAGTFEFCLRMYLEPKEEFKQIFNEGWRNQRDYLYVPNMHGRDWPKMKEMYGQLLPYVMHRADLNYLIDMMGAEIAIGHSYVRGGDMPTVPQSVGWTARRRLRN